MTEPRPAPDVRVVEGPRDLARAAAEEWARAATAAVAARGRFIVALAGGSTPRALYALLADPAAPFGATLPWGHTHVFFGDERAVPPDHPESNYGMAFEALLGRVPIPAGNVHRIRGELDPDAAARAYEAELLRFFAGPPRFDLALLGLGEDGHTASLFPGGAALEERERLVVASSARGGARRVTLTLPALAGTARVVFLVSGRAKAAPLARVLSGGPEVPPAARVSPRDGSVLWIVDRAAAEDVRGCGRRAGWDKRPE